MQDLDCTVAKLMNWKGQTVLGWFAVSTSVTFKNQLLLYFNVTFSCQAPGSDVTSRFETVRIASAYFRTIQTAMLKVIVCNFLSQHTGTKPIKIISLFNLFITCQD